MTSLPPVRVLLVDDVADLRFLYRLILKRQAEGRYEVIAEAGNGQEAIERAKELQPDLVLLDVSMPVMDGMEALPHLVKASPRSKIVMLSGFSAERLGQQALSRGAAHYLEKGVTPRDLVRELDRVVGRDGAGGPAARATAPAAAAGTMDEQERRLAALQEANRELEAFSFTVSHDLRAPLRGIHYLAQALEEDATELRPEHRDLLARMRAETDRMGRFLDDLLVLSRATRADLRHETLDLSATAREALAALARQEPYRKVRVRVEDGLVARGDPDLMHAALQNLLANAWKFTSKKDDAEIVVGKEAREGETAFFVRDNGAGFDPARAARLFEPFQRLHDQRDYAGTGVGLASVKRIVARHGGRLWAEGRPGAGATFWFTLP